MDGEFTGALVTGLGMMLVLEGLLYAGFPGALRNLASRLPEIGDNALRIFGIIAMMIGIALIWLVR